MNDFAAEYVGVPGRVMMVPMLPRLRMQLFSDRRPRVRRWQVRQAPKEALVWMLAVMSVSDSFVNGFMGGRLPTLLIRRVL